MGRGTWHPRRFRIRLHHGIQKGRYTEEVLANRRNPRAEGAKTVAALIVEPVTGTNGILIPPDGYLQGLRDLCTKTDILLIADEVMSGFGRTGEWFAINNWNVEPD
jgi:taurine--2-oxoglutarate transaminase